MKKLMYIIAGTFMLGTGAANAQKIGHVNSQTILIELPAYKAAEQDMKKWQEEMAAEDNKLKARIQEKIDAFTKTEATMTDAQKNIARADIMELQERLEKFEQDYPANQQKREQMYMEPLFKQVKDAIAKVAKTQGLNYVVDEQSLLFIEGGTDITPLVKKELGITATPTGPANTTPTTPAKPANK